MNPALQLNVLRAALLEGPEEYEKVKADIAAYDKKKNSEDDEFYDKIAQYIAEHPNAAKNKGKQLPYCLAMRNLRKYWGETFVLYWQCMMEEKLEAAEK